MEDASIWEKWVYLPLAVSGKQFTLNSEPFISFSKMVKLRNMLVHFDSDKLTFEKEAPDDVKTAGQLRAWINSGAFFEGTFIEHVFMLSLNGSTTVSNLIQQLHNMIGPPTPEFLDGSQTVLSIKTEKS